MEDKFTEEIVDENGIITIDMEEALSESIDYTTVAIASLLESLKDSHEVELQQMLLESNWIQSCLESGFLYPMPTLEAGEKTGTGTTQVQTVGNTTGSEIAKGNANVKTKDNSGLINALKEWIQEIIAKIRGKAIERSKDKWCSWVGANKEAIEIKAKNMSGGVKISPYHKGEWKNDASVAVNAIQQALASIGNKKVDNFAFATNIVDPKEVETKDANLSGHILNYFRFGEKNVNKVDSVNLIGNDLATVVPEMIDYVLNYGKNIPSNVGKISNAFSAKNLENAVKKATAESVNPLQYLDTLGQYVCETELTNLINYQIVTELGESNSNEINGPGKNTNGAKDDKVQNPDKGVEKVDDNGKADSEKTEAEKVQDKQEEYAKSQITKYITNVEYFCKLVLTGYATACDERFLVYLTVLKTIGKSKTSGNFSEPLKDNAAKNGASTQQKAERKEAKKPKTIRGKIKAKVAATAQKVSDKLDEIDK